MAKQGDGYLGGNIWNWTGFAIMCFYILFYSKLYANISRKNYESKIAIRFLSISLII